MATVEVFANAPIEEAILSIEMDVLANFDAAVDSFHHAVSGIVPLRENVAAPPRVFTRIAADEPAFAGYRFRSHDGLHVLQISRRSCSFHRLRPYVDWHQFAGTAQALWREFLAHFHPVQVNAIHLRYLNRIDLPVPFGSLREYLVTSPYLPQQIDAGVAGFLMRLSLRDDSVPAVAFLTQRAEPDPHTGTLPLVFDIDVRAEGEITSDDDLWRVIGRLRDYKNRLFFDSITESARELFR